MKKPGRKRFSKNIPAHIDAAKLPEHIDDGKCDCLNYYGDDPRIEKGIVEACPSLKADFKRREEHKVFLKSVDYLVIDAKLSGSVTLTYDQISKIRKYL